MTKFFRNYFENLSLKVSEFDQNTLLKSVSLINHTNKRNKKCILVGNGGSASIASHVSVDLTKAAKVKAINFNEGNFLTCYSNDYGYENWVKEALISYAESGDLLILISSSGSSKNIINGANQARKMKIPTITFTGFKNDNELKKIGDYNFWVDSNSYNIVEMTHHIWLVSIVDYLSEEIQ